MVLFFLYASMLIASLGMRMQINAMRQAAISLGNDPLAQRLKKRIVIWNVLILVNAVLTTLQAGNVMHDSLSSISSI